MHKGIYSHPSRTLHNQKQPKLFGIYTFNAYLCKDNLCRDCHRSSKESTMRIVLWCNGSTTGFGSVCPGSNPGRTTQKSAYADFFYYITNQDKTPLDCQQKNKSQSPEKDFGIQTANYKSYSVIASNLACCSGVKFCINSILSFITCINLFCAAW